MRPGTVALVLAAAAAHALWNIASKYKRGDTFLFVWAYTCASALLCLPIGMALLAKAQQLLDWRLAVGSAVSAALHIAYSLILQAGYDRAELGVVYSVARGTGPMLTMLFAVVLLEERPSAVAMLGALLIVTGILVVVGNLFRSGSHRTVPGILWGAATGATIAAYTLWDSYAVTAWHLAPVSYYAGTLLLQGLILTPIALMQRHRIPDVLRANAVPILVVAVLSPPGLHPRSHRHAECASGADRAAARVVHRRRRLPRVLALSRGPSRTPYCRRRDRAGRDRGDQPLMFIRAAMG